MKDMTKKQSGYLAVLLICLAMAFLLSFVFGGNIAIAGNPPSQYYVDEAKLPFDALPGTDTDRYWGVLGGAGYRIEVPKNWNGNLVLHCHGYRGEMPELTVDLPGLRDYHVKNGNAWASSSYSTNSYDPKAGVKDTHDLAMFFNGLVGKPKRIYLAGSSMGGHIIAAAIEQYPKSFDGALAMCGVMGDNEVFDYFLDFQVIAQWLTKTYVEYPFPLDYATAIVPQMVSKIGTVIPPFPPGYLINLTPDGIKLRTATKYFSGGQRPLFGTAFRVWGNFLFGQGISTDNRSPLVPGIVNDNMDRVYQLDDDPELSAEEILLNSQVLRVAADPQGRHPNGLANYPPISGNIDIPVLTLHGVGDLWVPFLMEQVYAQRVAGHGRSDLLVQRAIRTVEHCGISPAEREMAFADLVKWVEEGIKPPGDNVLDPSVVADPKFGCNFTNPKRSYDPSPWVCTTP